MGKNINGKKLVVDEHNNDILKISENGGRTTTQVLNSQAGNNRKKKG